MEVLVQHWVGGAYNTVLDSGHTPCTIPFHSVSSDYVPFSMTLRFTTSGKQCVNVSIIDDSIAETTERFQVNIFSPGALINTPSVSVIINDNDGNLQCHLPIIITAPL